MRVFVAVLALTLAPLAVACSGGGSSTDTPTGAETAAPAAEATTRAAKSATPPQETASVDATAPGETPTARPVPPGGTPAIIPKDETSFIQAINGKHTILSDCVYNPATDFADCSGVLYSIDPPIVAQGISCTLWKVDDQPYAVECSHLEPQGTLFYQIRQ
jgi:glucose/arabinose dehydrogenase